MPEQPDDLSRRFHPVRALGRGAMGEVWLAEDTVLGRQVAIKAIAPRSGAPQQVDLDRTMREARAAGRLHHGNAVTVFDLVMARGLPHLIMEYVPGDQTLGGLIRSAGVLDPREVARIGAAVADALAAAHALGIVHRDIKPANILMAADGVPKLADFGIARAVDDPQITATGFMSGTPAYLAPEVAQGRDADGRADIWSLGVTLYEALEGHSPFNRSRGDSVLAVIGRVLSAPVPPPQRGGPVADVVLGMLERDPARRPSAEQVAGRLRTAGAATHRAGPGPLSRATPSSLGPPPPGVVAPYAPSATQALPAATRPRSRRVPLIAAAGVLVVGAAAVVAIVATRGSDDGPTTAGRTGSTPTTSSPAGRSASSPPTASASTSTSGSATPTVATAAYSSPDGLTVQGPRGWTEDDSAGVPRVRDYVQPGGDRSTGTYFRIGVGNQSPAATIEKEAQATADYLTSSNDVYSGATILRATYGNFLSARSVDIEFTGTTKNGQKRHAKERLWISDGVTRIIQINAPDAQWSASAPVFDTLVAQAKISG